MSREFVVTRFSELLELPKDDTKCVNLEKSINNWAIKRSTELGDVPASDNHRHMNRYKSKFLEIQKCLRNSPSLKRRIVSGQLKSAVVVETPPNCLWPEGPLAKDMEISREKATKKEGKSIMNDPDYKGMFKCGKCKDWKTTYYEMQTRSADEPMTVFITCHICNSTWKS